MNSCYKDYGMDKAGFAGGATAIIEDIIKYSIDKKIKFTLKNGQESEIDLDKFFKRVSKEYKEYLYNKK